MSWTCQLCRLPDLHHGEGDGIGSCECPRCEYCGAAPMDCECESEDAGYFSDPGDGE